MNHARPASGASDTDAQDDAAVRALLALPAPRHLHEFLTRSRHLHFGYFEGVGDTLAQAQDRLIQRSARLLQRNSLVADVGCGLGGTVHLLASQGHRVFGIDPCASSIEYARARSSPRAQFLVGDLASFATRARGARFDALFLTEVLSQFAELSAVFGHCRALLRPGGLVLVHDVVRHPSTDAGPEGFHPRGALRAAADAAGFDLVEMRDATNRTAPTLSRLARALGEKRSEILAAFTGSRPSIAQELERFEAELRSVERAFSRQELFFETSVLRCSARFTSDSVVLRPRVAREPAPIAAPARRLPPS
jgi:cyclopropane fatty-acyl-phospholipid synthase-like methyltransferase